MSTASATYYIVDAKHGRSIVAGDKADNIAYHQDPRDRSNAKWALEPVQDEPGFFFIRDMKHKKCIVACNGDIYHRDPSNLPNAKWQLEKATDDFGSETFYLIDQKRKKAIVAGDNADNNLYHQPHNSRANARWALIPI